MNSILVAIVAVVAFARCDESANNSELCRSVYDALCVRAEECRGADFDLAECQAHYWEECRSQALQEGVAAPSAEEEQACIDAIVGPDGLPCSDLDPRILEVCDFLLPLPADADGDADGDSDGDGDGDSDADGDSDSDADAADSK